MYPTSNFWNIFTIFLNIVLGYNLSKILKKYLISFYKNKKFEYIFENKCSVHVYSKTQIHSKNNLNDF
jgi:hypothetical protein